MANTYSIGVTSANFTAAANLADLGASTTVRAKVREIGVFVSTAGASPTVALSRMTAAGTRTTPTTGSAEDVSDPAPANSVATAWSVAPTVSTNLRVATLPATLGAGIIWSWPPGQEILAANTNWLMVRCTAISAATTTAVNVYYVWTE